MALVHPIDPSRSRLAHRTRHSSAGTLTYTPSGTSGSATISVTLTDDASINGAALTTAAQTFVTTVTALTHFQQWALDNGNLNTSNPQNLINFAFGLNPDNSSRGVITASGGTMTLRGTPTVSASAPPRTAWTTRLSLVGASALA